jgi:hypothetical protein
MKRKRWKGNAKPDGSVGIGKNGAMPDPVHFVRLEMCHGNRMMYIPRSRYCENFSILSTR